jgi:hypothetical protein
MHDNGRIGGASARARFFKPAAVLALAAAMVLSVGTAGAQADDPPAIDLTPGPHIIADPNSPTGYTGHFVYYDPTATSIRFAADILLRSWVNPADPTIYQPSQYVPGLMRGGGGYDVQMTNAGNGYWYTDVPLAAGANQYWFYRNNDTNNWLPDPANPPINAPDGLTGSARRSFNKVFVPYDAVKQNFAPLEARQIELPRENIAHGTWSYVPFGTINGVQRTIGVYLPPNYDPNRATPYKTIYMQHGSGQDQSDWMNMGNVPVIMDNLIADGLAEPAVIITTNTAYLGASNQGYPNLRNMVIPFVELNYRVSTAAADRAFAGLSAGAAVTGGLINFDATKFAYYGMLSGGASVNNSNVNLGGAHVLFAGGAWDFGNPSTTAVNNLTNVNRKQVVVAGAHDFNTWNQLFTIFVRDYVWKPTAFNQAPVFGAGGETQSVAEGQALTFTVPAATDVDAPRDTVAYSASGLPAGATFNATTREFSWTPGYTQGGSYNVTITASDGTKAWSLSTTKTIAITVGQDLQVSASASIRCTAGKAYVLVNVANADAATVDLALTSTYGTKSFPGVGSGKSAAHSFTTRLASVPGGSVTVAVSTTIDGSPVTKQLTASYSATVCN